MTIKQIKKHKGVISWFLDNPEKGVWCSENGRDWSLIFSPSFASDVSYVINDDWADLSKQLIADKTKVEFLNDHTNWVKTQCDSVSEMRKWCISRYRIAEPIPSLEIGDWFTHEKLNHQVVEVLYSGYRAKNGFIYCTNLVKWIPSKDELVVLCNNNNSTGYIVGNYISIYKNFEWDNIFPIEYLHQLIQVEQERR